MCKVRFRRYEGCNHVFHEIEDPCHKFINECERLKTKPPSAKLHLRCEFHASKIKSCRADVIKPVNFDTVAKQKPRLIHLRDVRDPKDIDDNPKSPADFRHIIGGHCANPEFLPSNGIGGGREFREPAKGYCGYCKEGLAEIARKKAAERKEKSWFGI